VDSGAIVGAPAPPTREGYTFEGWYKETTYTFAWDFANDVVKSNTTLYAKWTKATAVATVSVATLRVYPNPTTGLVYIDNPAGAEAEVYTLGGILVLRSKAAVIDLSQHATGTYIIKVGSKSAKVLKQ
jgi:uncharacterized repeat protein (TIGR02543 family)